MREQTFPLDSERNRQLACRAIATAPPRRQCVISDMTRSDKQNRRLFKMIAAIKAAGVRFANRDLEPIGWYRVLTSAYLKEKRDEMPEAYEGLAGEIVTPDLRSASDFTIAEFTELMDWVDHWMATRDPPIPFGDPGPEDR